jgi:type III pantothenate kinase
VARFVADLGNTRIKLGRLGRATGLAETQAIRLEDEPALLKVLDRWTGSSEPAGAWALSSVNPRAAERLVALLEARGHNVTRCYRSAADVPVRHVLEAPTQTGADRAILAWTALLFHAAGPGLVVSCGTAITVERISAQGVWQGGAIAAGIGLSAQALHQRTAQLPWVVPDRLPPSWGAATQAAISAGLFWGAVGSVRELIARQSEGLLPTPWVIWTGGDAEILAPWVGGPNVHVAPDLVLQGLAHMAFGEARDTL